MNHCMDKFQGKRIKIIERKLIARDANPARPVEIHKIVLDVGKAWGRGYHPGQFVMVRIEDGNERIPLTVTTLDEQSGALTLVFQTVGASTMKLARLQAGQVVEDVTRPLGTPLPLHKPIAKKSIAVVVAGGVGVAPAYAKVQALHKNGYDVRLIIGARNSDLIIMLDEMYRALDLRPGQPTDKIMVATDDGSYDGPAAVANGSSRADRAMFVTGVLGQVIHWPGKNGQLQGKSMHFAASAEKSLTNSLSADAIAEIFAVGPVPMMKAVAMATEEMRIPTYLSLNTVMVDGTGMCGGCRISVEGKDFYVCKDGPTVMAHGYHEDGSTYLSRRLDWEEISARISAYTGMEQLSNTLLSFDTPIDELKIEKIPEIKKDGYVLQLAQRFNAEGNTTINDLIQQMKQQFRHVAGYLTLDQVILQAAQICTCPVNDKKKPCELNCPVSVNVQGFIGHLKPEELEKALGRRDGEEFNLDALLRKIEQAPATVDPALVEIVDRQIYRALEVIKQNNPIPEITGLVCPQEIQCQMKCISRYRRKPEFGKPTDIGKIEAFAAYWVRVNNSRLRQYAWYRPAVAASRHSGKKVIVIGSGPAGLVAAAELAKQGHEVTVYETLHEAGGVLIYGIPEFRLPKEIVRYEIEQIAALGVTFFLNYKVDNLTEQMKATGAEAAFVCTGAGTPLGLTNPAGEKLAGHDLVGVYSANEFLTRTNLMKGYLFPVSDTPPPLVLDKRVVVFGGGNVAMDAARCALRLGARDVTIMYRRSAEEIPARAEEYQHAMAEKIKFEYLAAPTEFIGEGGRLKMIRYQKNRLGEPDASGRRRPEPIEGEIHTMDAEVGIVAVGQGPNTIMDTSVFETKWGRIIVDQDTMATNLPGVFAGGDTVSGNGGTVIYAAGCGVKAARAVDEYLNLIPAGSIA